MKNKNNIYCTLDLYSFHRFYFLTLSYHDIKQNTEAPVYNDLWHNTVLALCHAVSEVIGL